MGSRNTRLRTKVTALLLSLAALWVFAAWVTLREGVNLLWVTQVNDSVVDPSEPLLVELQKERRISAVHLSDPTSRSRKEMEAQRKRSDSTLASFREAATGTLVDWATDEEGSERLNEVFRRLDMIKQTRQAVDAGRLNRVSATDAYSEIIDSIFNLYGALATLDDKALASDIRNLLALSRARDIITKEDALLSGALVSGRLSASEHAQFVATTGAWKIVADQAGSELSDFNQSEYEKVINGQSFNRLRNLETLVAEQGPENGGVPFTSSTWRQATDTALNDLNTMVLAAGDRVVERAIPVAVNVIVRLVLAGGLGLIAVIASIVLSITTARALIAQLQKLRDAAHELSDHRLPSIVERIGHGEKVDVAKEAPALDFGDDEIGQVGQAFNTMQRTAIAVAAEQAELRRSIRDILLSLARRTQGLVHRQLTVLDVMERRETDPEELKELFRLDHLAIRMRRNAENLIVLSGSSPARTWRRSVPMVDVVRGALAEVEDYTRVSLMPMGDVVLAGRAVGDVIHLLAELIENAVSFSPPYTNVQVSGQLVANGYVIEIEDRGLGMKPEDLEAANKRIADPPEFRISGTAQLGLYVVSQLAKRHDIQVKLKASPYGGTTVVVLLPQELVQLDPSPDSTDGGRERLPRRTPGRERGREAGVATATRPLAENVRTLSSARSATPLAAPTPVREVKETRQAPEPASRPEPVSRPRPEPVTRPATETEPVQEDTSEREPQKETPATEQKPVTEFTPSGLPFRVPQANLAPALREEAPTQPDFEEDDDERSPEEIRAMMGSLQSGTRLGRSEAAKMLDEQTGGTE
ncbi:sensor histidine kinase [Nonomuraea fastidiosa]|jgi:signal transduction histidine kinase